MILENEFDMEFMDYIRKERSMEVNKIVSMEYFISGIGSKKLYSFICNKLQVPIHPPISSFRLIHTQSDNPEMVLFREKYLDYVLKVISTIFATLLSDGGTLFLSGIFKEYFIEYFQSDIKSL